MENIDVVSYMGKVPPQAIDVEERLLGVLLTYNESIHSVSEVLKPEHFYKEAHSLIYRAILNTDYNGDKIDLITVTQQLKKDDKLEAVGGAYYLMTLSGDITTRMNIEKYAVIIKENFIKREVIKDSSELSSMAYDNSNTANDVIDKFAECAFNYSMDIAGEKYKPVVDIVGEIATKTDRIISGDIKEDGIMSHIKKLNEVIYGFKEPDMIVLAARPGAGKTALMVSLVKGMAENNVRIGIFSLEMSKQQLTYRLISQQSGMPYNLCIRPSRISPRELEIFKKAMSEISELPIYIDDTAAINIRYLKTKAKEMAVKDKVKIIFIDYLQLMRGISDNRSREAEVSEISRGIKAIAKELKIPIVALAQLSRAVEMRPDKRPKLSDLRESGSIEQDSDIVMFMFRPSYYKILEDPSGEYTPDEMKVLCEVEVAKHRNGPLETIPIRFDSTTMRFTDFHDIQNNVKQMELEIDQDPF